ncbi:DNA/RNA nuclease SfsA [Kushneria phosphatilytica]|uniref:DNA/RNA nuclease SfsA n=1 Tax=Kushneria phosphatilytica TaxID=657387 RepID=UPI0008DAEAEB|nr:DNA/RNA nuclease SfsA [Kushneria phosphatilytica]OHV11248.1 sugar fermentation stimulation protein SfsA [Kushneria phosphatilytica]
MRLPALTEGVLLRRYKRFLADIRLSDGREVVAHCPNTGSMRAVNIPGCRVWVSHSSAPHRKLSWTWELIELPDGAMASVHTGRTNAVIEQAFIRQHLPSFEGYQTQRREVRVAGARLDFCLQEHIDQLPAAFVEVKQVTLHEGSGLGCFPDAVSERGRRHLESLMALSAEGWRAVLLFCVAHTGIERGAPARHIDPRYAETLAEARRQGVEVLAVGCDITPGEIGVKRMLPIVMDEHP